MDFIACHGIKTEFKHMQCHKFSGEVMAAGIDESLQVNSVFMRVPGFDSL